MRIVSPMHTDNAALRMSDDAIRAHASELIHAIGINGAAKKLGVGRMTVLSIAAGAPVMPATFALIREKAQEAKP